MITHHSLPADGVLPRYLRRSSCGKVVCRIAYDPEHDFVHAHADGTPYGRGSSTWLHVDCEECLKKMKHWFVVGREKGGTDLASLTVTEDKVEKAVEQLSAFSDWVELVDPEGKIAPRTVWPRPS
jgi:hypothetical protein